MASRRVMAQIWSRAENWLSHGCASCDCERSAIGEHDQRNEAIVSLTPLECSRHIWDFGFRAVTVKAGPRRKLASRVQLASNWTSQLQSNRCDRCLSR